MKVDEQSLIGVELLYRSKFPNAYIQFILKAKPFWVSMRVDQPMMRTIKIHFLILESNGDRLYQSFMPWFHTIGNARSRTSVNVNHAMWGNQSPLTLYEDIGYVQHDYWWRF